MALLRRMVCSFVLLAACAMLSGSAASSPRTKGASPQVDRIAVVVMENREYEDVIGSSDAPYVNRLAGRYALATNFYAASHPSLPNYLALTGGSTFGISTDCTSCSVSGASLVDQLESAGVTWRAYMEGMPSACYKGAFHGRYAKKHNPFMYFARIRTHRTRCARVRPFAALHTDIRNDSLPSFVWVTPDLCHDGHDCDTATADGFLHRQLPPLLKALGPNGLLFLTWDEGSSDSGCCRLAQGGHIVTIVAGPRAERAVSDKTPFDSYSILRTIEELWGLKHLRHAGCACTASMTSLVR